MRIPTPDQPECIQKADMFINQLNNQNWEDGVDVSCVPDFHDPEEWEGVADVAAIESDYEVMAEAYDMKNSEGEKFGKVAHVIVFVQGGNEVDIMNVAGKVQSIVSENAAHILFNTRIKENAFKKFAVRFLDSHPENEHDLEMIIHVEFE